MEMITELDPQKTAGLLETLGLDEEPLGMFYTDRQPETGFSPKPGPLPTAEAEAQEGGQECTGLLKGAGAGTPGRWRSFCAGPPGRPKPPD